MRCPTCGAKFPKNANICVHCGTQMSQLETASNKAVTKAKKEYQPELIVYSSIFPTDLSYKKTLLLCIFLGLFGGHRYYTKQHFSAILMTIGTTIMLLASILLGQYWMGNFDPLEIGMSMQMFNSIISLVSICGAICIVKWAFDIIALATKRYKVPVVLGQKETKR